MLPRKHRLTQDKEVTRVLRQGRAVFTNLVAVKALANKEEIVRVAVVAGLKVHKRSTKRNLIKRRIRTLLSRLIPKITASVDMVVTAQPDAVGRTQADLGKALEFCFKKLGLLS